MAETDGAADYALEAMDRAVAARTVGGGAPVARRGIAPEAPVLPSLDFGFRAPSFLSARARWALLWILAAAGFGSLLVACLLALAAPAGHGAEWVVPPITALVVAAIAFALAYATVMGFGQVDLRANVGGASQPSAPTAPPATPPPAPGPAIPGPAIPGPAIPGPSIPGPSAAGGAGPTGG